MSQDDPFALPEEDRTVIRPAPGGRRPLASSPPLAPAYALAVSIEDLGHIGGLNPLLAAANPLLNLAVQLRSTPALGDLERLRETLVRGLREFESNARSKGVRAEMVVAARYCLCTFLDEVIATTPWGAAGAWANKSLLITFHNEAWGGEKFFALLKRVSEDAANNIDLLELMYMCLAFGFQGRYRVVDGGRSQLEELRDRLYVTIRAQRGEPESELSARWQSAKPTKVPLTNWVPLWVGAAVAVGVLLVVYLGLSWSLNRSSNAVYAVLQEIPDKFAPAQPAAPPRPMGLSVLLQPEIAAGWVSVTELADRGIVRLRGDTLFESGSASVNAQYQQVLARVAEALNSTPGSIVVAGHTDNRPMLSLRFPSNWDLSKARADAVVALLSGGLANPTRVRSEGRGDVEPLVNNDTPANRASNRRVDITVFNPVAGPALVRPGK